MTFTIPNFIPAIPEIFMLVMICVILMTDLFLGKRIKSIAYSLTQLTLIGAFLLTMHQYGMPKVYTFDHMYVLDKLAILSKLAILLVSFFVFLYSREYIGMTKLPRGEYHILGLFAVLGMMVLVSASNFLTLYLGLEVLSLPLYAMVALKRDSGVASEAAMKYFVMGALASGMLLYGLSMLYGVSHSLDFTAVAKVVSETSPAHSLILIFGLVFIIAGIAFKMGAAPFHMWVPDVYDGSPTSVTLFISSAPKIAALIMAYRLLVESAPGLIIQWQHVLMVIAVLSIVLGNVVAIAQSNIKRMLAYSSIAHMGYMLLGIIAGTKAGYASSLFYVFTYSMMSMGAFAMLLMMSKSGFEAENIEDLQGLNSRNPWYALMMLLIMFSMAGIPPAVGFFAKLGVLEAVINANMTWLAIVALIFAIVGAYYYLRVVKVMYFDDPKDATAVTAPMDMRIAITINGLAVIALGLFPSALIGLCRNVFFG